jgi:opacity protein-like surface antigen
MKLLAAALMAGLLLLSTQASAQVKPGTQQAAITLGWANPLSNDNVIDESETFGGIGPALGFNYLYQLQRYLSLGGDFNYKSLGDNDFTTGRGPTEIKSSAWTLLAIGRADLLPDNNIRPYGLMGLGVGGVRREVDFSQHPELNSSQTASGLAFALAGGVDYDINDAWLAGAELRYNIIGTIEGAIGTGHVSTLDVLFKLGYKF